MVQDWGLLNGVMNPAAALLAPFLLLLPSVMSGSESGVREGEVPSGPVSRPAGEDRDPWATMAGSFRPLEGEQVRIEQHVTVRIGPRPAPIPLPPSMFDDDFSNDSPRFVERKFGKCVPVGGIFGVQSAPGNRILLIMRDQRMVTATLKKGCNSRDFYSGFIVAKNDDGMVCTGRDQILSRSGASCQVESFRELVPVDR